jgi:hypothetical protein
MASTYTTNGGIEKIGTGEQSGTWGDTTNTNFDIIDRLTNGVGSVALSDADSNLETSDGTLSDGMFKVIVFSGSLTDTRTITVLPNNAQKLYFMKNDTGQSLTITQGSGGDVTLLNGGAAALFCDGAGSTAEVVDLTSLFFSQHGVTATAAELNYNDITTLGTSEASKVLTADANGDVTVSEEFIAKSYNETYSAVSSSSGTLTLDCETANVFQTTLTENVTTLTLSNPPASGTAYALTLKIIQDSTARTFAWPASVNWAGGTAATISTASGAVDIYILYTTDGGTNWYGFTGGKEFS